MVLAHKREGTRGRGGVCAPEAIESYEALRIRWKERAEQGHQIREMRTERRCEICAMRSENLGEARMGGRGDRSALESWAVPSQSETLMLEKDSPHNKYTERARVQRWVELLDKHVHLLVLSQLIQRAHHQNGGL